MKLLEVVGAVYPLHWNPKTSKHCKHVLIPARLETADVPFARSKSHCFCIGLRYQCHTGTSTAYIPPGLLSSLIFCTTPPDPSRTGLTCAQHSFTLSFGLHLALLLTRLHDKEQSLDVIVSGTTHLNASEGLRKIESVIDSELRRRRWRGSDWKKQFMCSGCLLQWTKRKTWRCCACFTKDELRDLVHTHCRYNDITATIPAAAHFPSSMFLTVRVLCVVCCLCGPDVNDILAESIPKRQPKRIVETDYKHTVQESIEKKENKASDEPPTAFIYYVSENELFLKRIESLVYTLRVECGVDAILDTFQESVPVHKPSWIADQIKKCDWTIVIWSKQLIERSRR